LDLGVVCGGDEHEDGAGGDMILGDGSLIISEDSTLVDEFEGVQLCIFSERLTYCGKRGVLGREGKGETVSAPFHSD
jgi:hypothetical protein